MLLSILMAHRTAATTKIDLTPDVSSAEVKKACFC